MTTVTQEEKKRPRELIDGLLLELNALLIVVESEWPGLEDPEQWGVILMQINTDFLRDLAAFRDSVDADRRREQAKSREACFEYFVNDPDGQAYHKLADWFEEHSQFTRAAAQEARTDGG